MKSISLLFIPDDIFKYYLLQYLSITDIVQLDNAIIYYSDRQHFLSKVTSTILDYDIDKVFINKEMCKWLGSRKFYLTSITIVNDLTDRDIFEIDVLEVFKYVKSVLVLYNTSITDKGLDHILKVCYKLITLEIESNHLKIAGINSIAKNCKQLETLRLQYFKTDGANKALVSLF